MFGRCQHSRCEMEFNSRSFVNIKNDRGSPSQSTQCNLPELKSRESRSRCDTNTESCTLVHQIYLETSRRVYTVSPFFPFHQLSFKNGISLHPHPTLPLRIPRLPPLTLPPHISTASPSDPAISNRSPPPSNQCLSLREPAVALLSFSRRLFGPPGSVQEDSH